MWQLIPLLTTLQRVLFSSLAQHTVSRTQHALTRSLTQHTLSQTQHAFSRTPHALYFKHNTLSFFFLQSTHSISNTTRSLPVAYATHSILTQHAPYRSLTQHTLSQTQIWFYSKVCEFDGPKEKRTRSQEGCRRGCCCRSRWWKDRVTRFSFRRWQNRFHVEILEQFSIYFRE